MADIERLRITQYLDEVKERARSRSAGLEWLRNHDAAFIAAARTDVEVLERMLREAVAVIKAHRERALFREDGTGASVLLNALARIEAMVPEDATTGG